MAQFKSSAREGSFSNKQLTVPDAVQKQQSETERQLRGMDDAQSYLEKNERIFRQAQQQAFNIEKDFRSTSSQLEQQNLKAQRSHTRQAYEMELVKKQNQDKYKIDTLGALIDFSKTALDTTFTIVKQNKELQLKAVNQIAFSEKYSHKDILNAQSVNSSISNAEFQRTNVVKKYLEEGKSQEFIDTMYNHLVKGGGYRNYIANSNVLREQAGINAQVINQINNNPSLSIEEKQKQIAIADARMRGELTIDGQTPAQQILEKAYNPTMRRALDRAEQVTNQEKRNQLAKDFERDQRSTIFDIAFSGGGFNAQGVMDAIATDPRPGAMKDTMEYLASADLTLDQIEQLEKAPIIKDGKVGNIFSFGYKDAAAVLKNAKKRAYEDIRAVQALEAQQKQLSAEMEINQLAQQLATDDGRLDNKDYRDISNRYYELAGRGADPKVLEGIKRQTVDVQLIPVMNDQLEEMRLNGTLSLKELNRINPPKMLYDQYLGAATRLDTIKATPQYKDLNTYLRGRIEGAIKTTESKLKFKDVGPQSDQFNWFVGEKVKKARKKVIELVGAGTPIEEAMNMVGTTVGNDAAEFLSRPEQFDGFTLKPYEKMVNETEKAQLVAQRRVTKFKGLTPTQQKDPSNWITSIGETALIAASKKLAETGTSEVLNVIGQRTGLTAYEVQKKLAEENPNIEPILINPTYVEIQNNWSPKQRYSFTSDKASNQQRLRELQQQVNEFENRNSFQPRESFQPSNQTIEPLNGTIQEKGNQAITYMTQDLGLSDFHAYGLLANAIRESSLQTTNPGDNNTSDGWFQWHAGRLSRAKAVLGDRWNDWRAQIQYALQEEGEPGQEYLQQNFSSRQEAADWWMKYWERPAHPERDSKRHSEILGNF
jgi:hypothetical protein